MAKTEKVLEGVSSVEIVSADGTTFIFDVEDLIIEADDGAPDWKSNYEDWLEWDRRRAYSSKFIHPDPTTYAIKGSMKPDSNGVWFKMVVKQHPIVRSATIEVVSADLPELERARKRVGAPSDASWSLMNGHTLTFTWKED